MLPDRVRLFQIRNMTEFELKHDSIMSTNQHSGTLDAFSLQQTLGNIIDCKLICQFGEVLWYWMLSCSR